MFDTFKDIAKQIKSAQRNIAHIESNKSDNDCKRLEQLEADIKNSSSHKRIEKIRSSIQRT